MLQSIVSQRVGRELATEQKQCITYIYHLNHFKVFGSSLSGDSQVIVVVKNPPANAGDSGDLVWIPGSRTSLEKEMATHSSVFAWKIQWTEEPGGLQFMGLQRVRPG